MTMPVGGPITGEIAELNRLGNLLRVAGATCGGRVVPNRTVGLTDESVANWRRLPAAQRQATIESLRRTLRELQTQIARNRRYKSQSKPGV